MDKSLVMQTLEKLGIGATYEFVPFSRSRNAAGGWQSLNWKVTLLHNGTPVLTTDYSAGSAHCPSGNKKIADKQLKAAAIKFECENGIEARGFTNANFMSGYSNRKILPDIADVVYSLVQDSEVMRYPSFEDWANEFGYESDSRKHFAVYNDCLAIALRLSAAFGPDGMAMLYRAYEDY